MIEAMMNRFKRFSPIVIIPGLLFITTGNLGKGWYLSFSVIWNGRRTLFGTSKGPKGRVFRKQSEPWVHGFNWWSLKVNS